MSGLHKVRSVSRMVAVGTTGMTASRTRMSSQDEPYGR
jgi:hypothetical protein